MGNKFSKYFSNYSVWFLLKILLKFLWHISLCLVLFYDAWLCRYPRSVRITYDNGSEFKKHFKALCKEYDLNQYPTTVKNPQANSIVERVHQTVNNMIRCFDLNTLQLNPKDPLGKFQHVLVRPCVAHTILPYRQHLDNQSLIGICYLIQTFMLIGIIFIAVSKKV